MTSPLPLPLPLPLLQRKLDTARREYGSYVAILEEVDRRLAEFQDDPVIRVKLFCERSWRRMSVRRWGRELVRLEQAMTAAMREREGRT